MNFKVGQRVWVNSKKHIMYFLHLRNEKECRVAKDLHTENYNNSRFDKDCVVDIKDIHQTADDMFEELGYEKKIINGVTNYIKELISVGGQRKIAFYNSNKGYSTTIDRWNEYNLSAIASIPEHLAIHQKMIELGWIE